MVRRRKTLSEEDLAHWRAVAATAEPLKPAPAAPLPLPPAPKARRKPAPVEIPAFHIGESVTGPPGFVVPAPEVWATNARQVDRRIAERLHRGRLRPEAVLDLHGMTADAAHSALLGFVISCQDAGKRLVLVITGKGRPRFDEPGTITTGKGVLRHSVPHWLAQPLLRGRILQVTSAHARHGGGGALYVYLRRR